MAVGLFGNHILNASERLFSSAGNEDDISTQSALQNFYTLSLSGGLRGSIPYFFTIATIAATLATLGFGSAVTIPSGLGLGFLGWAATRIWGFGANRSVYKEVKRQKEVVGLLAAVRPTVHNHATCSEITR